MLSWRLLRERGRRKEGGKLITDGAASSSSSFRVRTPTSFLYGIIKGGEEKGGIK